MLLPGRVPHNIDLAVERWEDHRSNSMTVNGLMRSGVKILVGAYILLSTGACVVPSRFAAPQELLEVEAVTGCYELSIRWPLAARRLPEYRLRPPPKLYLSLTPDDSEKEAGGERYLLVEPLSSDTPTRPFSFWSISAAGVVEVIWGDGYGGVGINLRPNRSGSRLTGEAALFSDVGGLDFPLARAHTTARRIRCGSRSQPQ